MTIIRPDRTIRKQDPNLTPIKGKRGPCAICGKYSNLTDSHILPQAIGNKGAFHAEGFLTSVAVQETEHLKRRFPNGVHFKTLCGDCNSALGGAEDRALVEFYAQVRKFAYSNLAALPEVVFFNIQPNLVIRGIFAHLLSSNDEGVPSYLDSEVRKVFRGEAELRSSPLKVFYWRYGAKWLSIARNISVTEHLGAGRGPDWINLLKLKPIGFAVTNTDRLRDMPCMNDYIQAHDSLYAPVPFRLARTDMHPHWPATTGETGIMATGSNSGGLVATPAWRSH